MRIIILFFSLLSVLCLISCGKTDSDSKTEPPANTPPETATPTAPPEPPANTPPETATPTAPPEPPANTPPETATPTAPPEPPANTPPETATPTAPTQTPPEHFILYIPTPYFSFRYKITFYKDERYPTSFVFAPLDQCFKVHRKWLSQIKVTESRGGSFNEVIYEPSRSDYRVGIYKPNKNKNSDHLIKVEANNREYLRFKNECRFIKP